MFLSCTKDDATNLSLTKQDVTLKVGQSDTVNVTVSYTGDQAKVPVTVTVSDNQIVSVELLTTPNETNKGNSSFSRTVVIKALSSGTTGVVIHAGTQNITCSIKITQTTLVLNQSVVMNYGLAEEKIDNNVFTMYLFSETFQLDRENEAFAGDGQFIHFESFFPPTQTLLPTGTFSQDMYGTVNTFLPGSYSVENGQSHPYGTYIETDSNNQATYILVKSGKYTVKNEGTTYYIEGDLVIETNEIVHFSYTGDIAVVDKAEKPAVVTPQFTKGDLFCAGDYYNMGVSDTFFAYLETSNVNINSNTLDGEVLVLQINEEGSGFFPIVPGTYKMMTQSELAKFEVLPFTLVPGNFHVYKGKVIVAGCRYYNGNSRKNLISGNVEIESCGKLDMRYSGNFEILLKYSFYDRIGSLVTGSFNGTMHYTAPADIKSVPSKDSNPVVLPSSLDKSQLKNFGRIHENKFQSIGMK